MIDSSLHASSGSFAFGLTEGAVEQFRDIMRREYGEDLSPEAAWARAIEVLALFRALIGPVPTKPRSASSNIAALDGISRLSNL